MAFLLKFCFILLLSVLFTMWKGANIENEYFPCSCGSKTKALALFIGLTYLLKFQLPKLQQLEMEAGIVDCRKNALDLNLVDLAIARWFCLGM